MAESVILNFKWFLFICIGVLINEVLCIELNMITENVIKGEPIHLFCHIPNFTNIASFDMPNGLPFRYVLCNNRDACSINKHELFNVNSNSSGLILTLNGSNEKIEGKYVCTYKGEVKTYSLNISALDIIDRNNGCNITSVDVEYKCQTKCLAVRKNQVIMWEFQTNNNETFTWNTPASNADCLCCKNNKQQLISFKKISSFDGMMRCFITVSRDVTLWSRPIRVKSVADGDHTGKTTFIVLVLSILLIVTVVAVALIFISYKRRQSTKKNHIEWKQTDIVNSSEDEPIVIVEQNDTQSSSEGEPMVIVEQKDTQCLNAGEPITIVEHNDVQCSYKDNPKVIVEQNESQSSSEGEPKLTVKQLVHVFENLKP